MQDISGRIRAEKKSQYDIKKMGELRHALERLNRSQSTDDVYHIAVDSIMVMLGSDRASILQFGADDKVHFAAWHGLSDAYRRAVDGHCPWQQDEIDAQPICMPDIEKADLPEDLRRIILSEGIRAAAFFPLISHKCLLGKYMAYYAQPHDLSEEDINFGKILADDLVASINRLKSVEDLLASQERLVRDHQTMRAILNHAPMGIWMLDADQRMQFMNRAFAESVGISEQAFLNVAHYSELMHEKAARQCMTSDERCFASQELVTSQEHILCVDGKTHVFEVVKVPLKKEQGEMTGLVGLAIDATDRLEAEQEKIEMQRQVEHTQRLESLGVLAGGIAHDFNNILTAIMGNAVMAQRKCTSDPVSVKGYLEKIVSSSEKAALLCQQMLAYSGKGQFIITPIDLSVMVDDIITLLEVSIHRGVVLRYHLAESLPLIEADESQLQQVIMNLVINASDAIAGKSGIVAISTGVMYADADYFRDSAVQCDIDLPDGRYVFLEITDNGSGMSDEVRGMLFEPFFTTKFTGRGLGMSAVLGIVRGHHGSIKVYSEEGKGTTFKILFPVAESIRAREAAARQSDHSRWQVSGTILIVDDDETIREVAAMMMEDMGFEVLSAVDGLDAVAVYRQHQKDIVAVLLDMTMPKMDGKDCFRELRRINKNIVVVLSSGYNETEATSRFTGTGLAGFVQKPYSPDMLEKVMHAVLPDHPGGII